MAGRPARAVPSSPRRGEELAASSASPHAPIVPRAEPRLALGVVWAAGLSLAVFWGPLLLVGWRLLR